MAARFCADSRFKEKFQFWGHVAICVVLIFIFVLRVRHFYGEGLAVRDLPTPSDFAAVLVDATSPRDQASIWISTPKDINVAVDPSQNVTLQFYASFETSDPNTEPPVSSSEDALTRYNVSFILVDRLAEHLEECQGAQVSDRSLDQLTPEQKQMAAQALPIGGLTESGPNPPTGSPAGSDNWSFKLLSPLTTRDDGWESPLGHQPTLVIDFTCTFRPEAFWLDGKGSYVVTQPAVYGNLKQDGGGRASAQQRLIRRFLIERPAPGSALTFIDSDALRNVDSNQNDRYETPDVTGGSSVSIPATRSWYSDQNFENTKAHAMFWLGIFVSLLITASWELLGLGWTGASDRFGTAAFRFLDARRNRK